MYDPLPIDNSAGFPQSFSLLLNGVSYFFSLYVNIPAAAIGGSNAVLSLPADNAFLVVSVDSQPANGERTTVLLRKVVTSIEYSAGAALSLYFPQQQVAVANLNGQGNFGTNIVGGAAPQ